MAINSDPHIHQLVICANVLIKKDNKYLVIKRSPLKKYAPGIINPVGGKVDQNENPYQAIVREAMEETGLTIHNITLKAVIMEIKPVSDEPYNWLIYHFVADYLSGELTGNDEGEFLWMSKEEIINEELFPSLKLVIDNVLDDGSKISYSTNYYDELENIIKTETL